MQSIYYYYMQPRYCYHEVLAGPRPHPLACNQSIFTTPEYVQSRYCDYEMHAGSPLKPLAGQQVFNTLSESRFGNRHCNRRVFQAGWSERAGLQHMSARFRRPSLPGLFDLERPPTFAP